jgi:hypothetical protein
MRCNILDDSPMMHLPKTLAKSFIVIVEDENGQVETILQERENVKRNHLISVAKKVRKVSLLLEENWGQGEKTTVFTFEIE